MLWTQGANQARKPKNVVVLAEEVENPEEADRAEEVPAQAKKIPWLKMAKAMQAAQKPKDSGGDLAEDQDLHLAQNQDMEADQDVMDQTDEVLAEEEEAKLAVEADKGAKWDPDENL